MKAILYTADVRILTDERLFAAAYRAASPARREKADRLRFPEDKRLSLGAALLLRLALGEADVENVRVLTDADGKPYLDGLPGVFFNLSHSGTVAACAISPFAVGCDVERIGSAGRDVLAIAKRFFCPLEYEWIASAGEEQASRFCRLWTLKESFVKATGRGLRLSPDSFCVLPAGDGVPPVAWGDHVYRFSEIGDLPGYRGAVCVLDGASAAEHRTVDLASLLGEGGTSDV